MFLFVAPFSTDSIFITCDLNLDMRFVLILNYKHVRAAGLTVRTERSAWLGTNVAQQECGAEINVGCHKCFLPRFLSAIASDWSTSRPESPS